MMKTEVEYLAVIDECRRIFLEKLADYGASWRILRLSSITDQIYIKAQRIRSFEEKGVQKIKEGIRPEYIGIINYSIIALIQMELGPYEDALPENQQAKELFDHYFHQAKDLMINKNHDYGEAWRNMRRSSFTDIILMRLLRIKQIENNQGMTSVSEGIDANYFDMINYAVFALIKLNNENN